MPAGIVCHWYFYSFTGVMILPTQTLHCFFRGIPQSYRRFLFFDSPKKMAPRKKWCPNAVLSVRWWSQRKLPKPKIATMKLHPMRQPSKSLVCKESSKRLTEKSLEKTTEIFFQTGKNDKERSEKKTIYLLHHFRTSWKKTCQINNFTTFEEWKSNLDEKICWAITCHFPRMELSFFFFYGGWAGGCIWGNPAQRCWMLFMRRVVTWNVNQ